MKHNQPCMKIVLKYYTRQQNIRYTLYKPIYIYIYKCIYVSINSYVHIYIYVYTYIYIHVHSIFIHRYTYTSIYLHTYIYMYISQNKHRFTPNCKPPTSPGLRSRVDVPFLQPSRHPGGTFGDRLTSRTRRDCCGCSYSSGEMRPV